MTNHHHSPTPHAPNLRHIQNLVAKGYDTHHSRYLVLTIQDCAATQQFLRSLLAQRWTVPAEGSRRAVQQLADQGRCPASIGFTFAGLQKLQLPTPYLRVFQDRAPAFAQGAAPRAAHRLADTGPSAASLWESPFHLQHAHVFLALHADDADLLQHCTTQLRALAGTAFTEDGWASPFDGAHLGRDRRARRVHFGYLDGITNPRIQHIHDHSPHHAQLAVPELLHAPGECLLGYENDEKYNRWLIASEPAVVRQFFANGSFSAFRKMAQDTAAFNAFVEHSTQSTQGSLSADTVRAKLLGRWDDGQVVSASAPDAPAGPAPTTRAGLNDFDFQADPQGLGCPFGAHIRRMNPRADPVVPFRKRVLVRRGIPYGPAFEAQPAAERGLLGLFFCASLEDQFEHLLAEWGNKNPFGTAIRGNAKDPLIGNHAGSGGVFDIPTASGPHTTLTGFTPFVTTRGTLYSFFPSLPTLRTLAG